MIRMQTWKHKHIELWLTMLLCMSVWHVTAQNVETKHKTASLDSIQQLQEVTISSTQPSRTIATSQTLQSHELQALSTTSVADALKYFAGVQIKDYFILGGSKITADGDCSHEIKDAYSLEEKL